MKLINSYLEKLQEIESSEIMWPVTQRLQQATAATIGSNITGKRIALDICYKKYCNNFLPEEKNKIMKCKLQCYYNYLKELKNEEIQKVNQYKGILRTKQILKVKTVNWELNRILHKINLLKRS